MKSRTTDKQGVTPLDPVFRNYDGPSARIPGETNAKLIRRRHRFKFGFLEFARSSAAKDRILLAVTFTYPPSAAEHSLYGDMVQFAERVSRETDDSLWVVANEARPRTPASHKSFHWHGIAVISPGGRSQRWFKDQWSRRVGANRSAIDVRFLMYSDARRGHRFEESAARWINYCCRAPPPEFPLPIKYRVVASGVLAKIWKKAAGHRPVTDAAFEPHSWIDSRVQVVEPKGPKHEPCRQCGGEIPDSKRRGALFCSDSCRDAFHNAEKAKARAKPKKASRR